MNTHEIPKQKSVKYGLDCKKPQDFLRRHWMQRGESYSLHIYTRTEIQDSSPVWKKYFQRITCRQISFWLEPTLESLSLCSCMMLRFGARINPNLRIMETGGGGRCPPYGLLFSVFVHDVAVWRLDKSEPTYYGNRRWWAVPTLRVALYRCFHNRSRTWWIFGC